MDIISNCCLCETRSLYVLETDISQCLYCGYVTSDKFKGSISNNEEYKKLPEDMQKMAKESGDQIWIPSVMTLPFGKMKDIPKKEQKNYPDGKGDYYKKRYDNMQTKLYKEFHIALESLNGKYESDDKSETKIKLPKLKKVNA